MMRLSELRGMDPRYYQIACLVSFLVYGMVALDFDVRLPHAAAMIGTALITQYVFTRLYGLPHFDPRSPFISSLSLCLLIRTNSLWLAMAVAFVAIASKFVIRRGGKHVFNPTNFAIVVMIVLSEGLWVSPGQWGSAMWVAFLVACLGIVVIHRSSRSDVTFALIGFYALALLGRALWLGDPLSIPIHQLQSGAFLLFAFFMISDPKTTPDSRAGRILFAFLVTAGAVWVQFGLFRQNGFFYALTAASLVVPLIDRWLPGKRYEWSAGPSGAAPKGESNEVEHGVPNTGGLPVPYAAR